MPAETTFGIDLGTTHSCIAWVDEAGKAVVIRNDLGEETTPSVVYFEAPMKVLVGASAKNSALLAPQLVAALTKRLIGTTESAGTFHGKTYSPEEIGALILRDLARFAEAQTGVKVENVVITVPAYFGVAQQQATRRAGEIAGLHVLDVLPEPVAAALNHQAPDKEAGTRHVFVCDLGGGTFDTTVIRFDDEGAVQVVCTHGDGRLGGADWDKRVQDHLLACFTREHPDLDPTRDDLFLQDLARIAEQLKKDLSSRESRTVGLRFSSAVARVTVTRSELEELTGDLLDRVADVAGRTVKLARERGVDHFDHLVLVGGMAKMPAVARRLSGELGLPGRLHEPDLAVAKGAAIHAAFQHVKQGGSARSLADRLTLDVAEVEAMAARKVTAVVPKAFGVMAVDSRDPIALTDPLRARKMIVHLLQANTTLPADTGPYPFAVVADNQRMAEIEVWEQAAEYESDELSANVRIGRGMLRNLPARPAGSPFNVTFFMSETGLLTVRALEPSSGATVSFDLQIGEMDKASVASARADIAGHEVRG
ncbi:Hsp70 family protein [Amycolatopsis sp. NPDC049252]|uniref:Hsp70 family protein n=1 Tax=Amycolatopsis sp. NPDC049252 TaxID=3363933 RepID=UPI0037183E6B